MSKLSPSGTYALSIEECRVLLAKLTEVVEDHFGLSPDEVTWGHVADVDRVHHTLKRAAFEAGISEDDAR